MAPQEKQKQHQFRDISGFPDDDWFLHAQARTCARCGKNKTYSHEFYHWPEFGAFPQLYCWDCWEAVSGKRLDRGRKPPRKEAR